MVQPYLQRIDHEGETSLVFIRGSFSHAVRKSAVLDGPDTGVDRRFLAHGGVKVRPRTPTRAQLAVAHRALAAVPGGPTRLLYARVDLVPGPDGEPLLIELELTEPQLYFELSPEAASQFTAAVVEKRPNPNFVTATDGSRRHCDSDSAAFTSGGSYRVSMEQVTTMQGWVTSESIAVPRRQASRARLPGLIALLLVAAATSPARGQPSSEWPIVELRQYTLQPGRADELISLFEAQFVESQEAVGMRIVGTFRDLDKQDRFVWIRAFKDMTSRAEALRTFYSGPVWKAHGKAAASTMIDASNVLLLRNARPVSGFNLTTPHPPKGATAASTTLIVANIYYFDGAVDPSFADFFDTTVKPQLTRAGLPVLATFVSETAPNTYAPLPVREHDRVFVWFSRFDGESDYERRLAALSNSAEWKTVSERLRVRLKGPPEVLRLQPTPRSQLRD